MQVLVGDSSLVDGARLHKRNAMSAPIMFGTVPVEGVPVLASAPEFTDEVPSMRVHKRRGRRAAAPPDAFEIPEVREGFWDRFTYTLKSAVMKCFCFGEEAAAWESQRQFDAAVRYEMVYKDAGNDVNVSALVEAACEDEVRLVPKLVARAAVGLRMRLGKGAMNSSVPGNVSLVRDQIPKFLREHEEFKDLRDIDKAAHLASIERAFFGDDTHYQVPEWRAKAVAKSSFLQKLVGGRSDYAYDY